MKHLIFFFLLLSFSACESKSAESKKPNILFLLADDLGYGELGSYGQQTIKTPNLDKLAEDGMRLTDFYAGSPVCSPSRSVLMTGKHLGINTIRGNNGIYEDNTYRRMALEKDEITLGEMMQGGGYQTAFIGKWHLDDPNDVSTWAHSRGFDYAIQEQWSSKHGGMNFDGPMEFINGMQDSVNFDWTKWNSMDEYRTDLAINYLEEKRVQDKPLFLFMSYRAPHGHEKVIGNKTLYADRGWPEYERRHAAKITLLDQQIGILLKKLEEKGELENTLVLFTSDNGPHQEGNGHDHEFFNSNGALKGYKRDVFEGGIRVPFIAYWKDKIEAGSTSNYVGGFQDFMPLLAEIADVETPEQSNGISFLPTLKGKTAKKHDQLHWEFFKGGKNGFRQAIRKGNWKAVRYGLGSPTKLFDLNKDVAEQKNIAGDHPEIIKDMNRLFIEKRGDNPHYPYGGGDALKFEPGEKPDLRSTIIDLIVPPVGEGEPTQGGRVKVTVSSFSSTEVYHLIYLPTNWEPNKKYPVIVEYAGNGPWSNSKGDISTGKVEGCNLGYGISGGKDFICLSLPFISEDGKNNQKWWWGDIEATKKYCIEAIEMTCRKFGGDSNKVILAGFSRGAIGVNYIGLHDNEISKLWTGFIANSHYDGVKEWNYPDDDRKAAINRLKRLNGRPQFICQEGMGTIATSEYLSRTGVKGNFTFVDIPYRNHTNSWILHDIAEREIIRKWIKKVVDIN